MFLHQWIIVSVCLCLVGGQVLNGYINPMWMSDRRARARSYFGNQPSAAVPTNSDYYTARGGYYGDRPDLRRMSDYYYLDDMGRYHPIYRDDRIYRSDSRSYFDSAEQQHHEYIADPPSPHSLTEASETEHHNE